MEKIKNKTKQNQTKAEAIDLVAKGGMDMYGFGG